MVTLLAPSGGIFKSIDIHMEFDLASVISKHFLAGKASSLHSTSPEKNYYRSSVVKFPVTLKLTVVRLVSPSGVIFESVGTVTLPRSLIFHRPD